MVWRAFGVASNANLTKSWYGKGKVGVALATPTIWLSPLMPLIHTPTPTPTPTTFTLQPTTYSLQKHPCYRDKLRIEERKIMSISIICDTNEQ